MTGTASGMLKISHEQYQNGGSYLEDVYGGPGLTGVLSGEISCW